MPHEPSHAVAAMIVAYLVGTTLAGIWFARRSRTSSDWAVAGGGMGVMMVAVGIAGTRIGGAGTYGVAGKVMSEGVWQFWYGVNTFVAMAIVGAFFAVPYRRLRLHTVGEIFSRRYDSTRCRTLTSLCVQTEYFIVNLIEVYLVAIILRNTMPWPGEGQMPWAGGIAIAATIIVGYTALGGLWGSSATNLIHCATVVFGLIAVVLIGADRLGGWGAVAEKVDLALAERAARAAESGARVVPPAVWWSLIGGGWLAIVGDFFSTAIHTPAASIYVNFSTATRSERRVLPAFLIGGAIAATMSWVAAAVGALSFARYGDAEKLSSYATITRFAQDLHPAIGGIALAAILAAVISSGGPILLASATMFVNDWLPFAKNYSPERRLKAFRRATAIYGAVAAVVVWAWVARYGKMQVLDMLLLGFAMVVPPAIAVGYILYWRRTTEASVFWGILLGYAGGALWFAMILVYRLAGIEAGSDAGALARFLHWCFAHRGEGIDPSYATTLIPLVAIPAIAILGRRDAPEAEARADVFYEQLRPRAPEPEGA